MKNILLTILVLLSNVTYGQVGSGGDSKDKITYIASSGVKPTCNAALVNKGITKGYGNRSNETCKMMPNGSSYQWVDEDGGLFNPVRFGADPTGVVDSSAAFNATSAAALAETYGGEIGIPAGSFRVTWNLSAATSDFTKTLKIKGAGRFATKLIPVSAGTVIIDASGRNYWSLESLTIDSTVFASQCAILMARHTLSTNANNNYFRDIWVTGSYTKASVVSLAAESASWIGCRFENSNVAASHTTFFTGWTNADISISVATGLTLSTGPNTNNTMTDCEFYAPYASGQFVIFSGSAGYSMTNCTVIGGSVNDAKLVVYKNPIGTIFQGPVTWTDSHFEIFGTGNVIHYLDSGGSTSPTYWNGINNYGGSYVIDDGTPIIDYDRTIVGNQPVLQRWTWTNFETVDNLDVAAYAYALIDSNFTMKTNGGTSKLVLLGYSSGSLISVSQIAATQLLGNIYTAGATSAPTTGTYSIGTFISNTSPSGGALGWQCTTSGTLGTLNGGATTGSITNGTNTLTVSSATGLSVGQKITVAGVAGSPFVVSHISGTTVKLTTNAGSTGTTVAVGFSAGAFTAIYGAAGLTAGRLPYVAAGGSFADSANATLDANGNIVATSIDFGAGVINDKVLIYHSGNTKYGYGLAGGELRGFVPTGASNYIKFGNLSTSDGTTFTSFFRMSSNTFAPETSGGLDLGTSSLPFGNTFLALSKSITLKTGSNACAGWATLSSGSVVVSTTCIGTLETDTGITLTPKGSSTGVLRISATTASTSFTITSTDAASSDKVYWQITKLN